MSQNDNQGYVKQSEESSATLRSPQSPAGRAVFWIGVAVSLVHIYFNTLGTLSELWTAALHFAGFALLCALAYPLYPAHNPQVQRRLLAVDLLLGLLAVACVLYLILAENAFYDRGSNFIFSDWIFAVLCVALALEFTRRTTGWVMPILILLALSYVMLWGRWVGGVFHFPGLSAETVLFRQYFGGEGMFGSIARISYTYVFMFILFGAFLVRSGAGDFIIDLARVAAGRLTGGPGLVAVLGSALMGSISGSAVANTASTGVITIPLMKKSGFPPRFAAGVEAAASTGGQLMPPVMGAGAFVMSTYTQIPYLQIIGVALLPALLYFFSVAVWVRIEAMKHGIRGVEAQAGGPGVWEVLKDGGHNLIPIGVLVSLLIMGFTPTYAAAYSIVAVVAASWLSPHRMGLQAVLEALAMGARNMIPTAILLVAVGIVVNVVATTGIGNTFSLMINDWAGGSLLITILLIGLASLVLGMGLPVTAAYIVLATLSAPAIYELIIQTRLIDALASGQVPEAARVTLSLFAPDAAALGSPMPLEQAAALAAAIPADFRNTVMEQILSPAVLTAALLSAHMIIYWLSQDSNVTPPVCLTAFTAAAIAGSPPMSTGVMAWKIAKGLYIIPLLFAYTPFLGGPFGEVLTIFCFGCLGIYALAGALEGYLEAPLPWWQRLGLLGAGTALLWPGGWTLHLAGLAFLALMLFFNLRARGKLQLAR
ncbi:MAG: TRAP transporter permease [Candidatus Competibacteraceae bacterium]|nr:TRAP transporter permease [Candidatus Competibacteraceae bacterium]